MSNKYNDPELIRGHGDDIELYFAEHILTSIPASNSVISSGVKISISSSFTFHSGTASISFQSPGSSYQTTV